MKHGKNHGLIWMITKENLELIVQTSLSFAEILRKVGFRSWSSNHYESLKCRLNLLKISYSHVGGVRSRQRAKCLSRDEALQVILIKESTYHQRTIRDYIKRYNLIQYQCECGQADKWNNKTLVLQLDHINGDCKDNRLENLRWLCPNCHSQTPTFGVKNTGICCNSSKNDCLSLSRGA